MKYACALLLHLLYSAAALEPPADVIVLRVAGRPSTDVSRGIELGVAETAQTARLLQKDVRLSDAAAEPHTVAGIIAAEAAAAFPPAIPTIHIGMVPPNAGRCEFSVAAPLETRDGAVTSLWHPTLERFGASELNERFRRRYASEMSAEAWAGWVAVKALVEAALRQPEGVSPCEALAKLRFDGHKGRPLFFDLTSRVLVQPFYRVRDGRVLEEVK